MRFYVSVVSGRTPSAMKQTKVVKRAIDHGIHSNVHVWILGGALVLHFTALYL